MARGRAVRQAGRLDDVTLVAFGIGDILGAGIYGLIGNVAGEVADGAQSVILEQVRNGIAVRMAVLYLLAGDSDRETTA